MTGTTQIPQDEPGKDNRTGQPAPAQGGVPPGVRFAGGGSPADHSTGPGNLALSVTRHTQITGKQAAGPGSWGLLANGVDTLDLAVYVRWGSDWNELYQELLKVKSEASGQDIKKWRKLGGEESYVYPSGKPPMFCFHILTLFGQLYIGKSPVPKKNSPNVYVSFEASALWCLGLDKSIELLRQVITELNGTMVRMLPSRFDLCADFLIPDGLSLEFLRNHLVSYSSKTQAWEDGEKLQTFYVGDKKSPIQLRIYDKSVEVSSRIWKNFFWEIWKIEKQPDVWRVEFQLRREWIRDYGIDSVDDMKSKLGMIWQKLTGEAFSFRLLDNENTSRRSVHPWWEMVQSVAERFGESGILQRRLQTLPMDAAAWYVAHVTGLAVTFGALRGRQSLDETLADLFDKIYELKTPEEFSEALKAKRMKLGRGVLPTDSDYPQEWDRP